MTVNESSAVKKHNNKWRVVDIVVAAIVAVAAGVIFWGWDVICAAPITLFEAVTPGFEGLLNGIWLFAGPLAALIVRKPGAALFTETLAAAIELAMGNPVGHRRFPDHWHLPRSYCRNRLCDFRVQALGFAVGHHFRHPRRFGMLPLQLDRKPRLGRLAYCRQLRHFRYFRRFGGWSPDVSAAAGYRQNRRA